MALNSRTTPSDAPMTGAAQRLLFVEDDQKLCAFLSRYFGGEGYQTHAVHDGDGMRRALARDRYDLVVLDLGLPGQEDGYSLARDLKSEGEVGILILSGRQEPVDRIVGLEIGADDYLCKPFEPRELLARVRAILRRVALSVGRPSARGRHIAFDGWVLDLDACTLARDTGQILPLTSQEFKILSILAERPGRVLNRDQILDLAMNRHWAPSDRSVDVMIGKIRRKIGDTRPGSRRIRTVRGTGYMFVPPS